MLYLIKINAFAGIDFVLPQVGPYVIIIFSSKPSDEWDCKVQKPYYQNHCHIPIEDIYQPYLYTTISFYLTLRGINSFLINHNIIYIFYLFCQVIIYIFGEAEVGEAGNY